MQREPRSTALMSLTPLTPPSHTWSTLKLMQPCPLAVHIVSPEALLDTLSLTSSGVSSTSGKFQEKSTIKSSIALTLTLPLLLCTKTTFLFVTLKGGEGGYRSVLRETSSSRSVKSTSTVYMLRLCIHERPLAIYSPQWNVFLFIIWECWHPENHEVSIRIKSSAQCLHWDKFNETVIAPKTTETSPEDNALVLTSISCTCPIMICRCVHKCHCFCSWKAWVRFGCLLTG